MGFPHRGRKVDEAARAVQRLDEVEHAVGLENLELALQIGQIGRAGERGRRVAFGGQRGLDGGDLLQHVALVGGRVGGDVLMDQGDAHGHLGRIRAMAEAMMRPISST